MLMSTKSDFAFVSGGGCDLLREWIVVRDRLWKLLRFGRWCGCDVGLVFLKDGVDVLEWGVSVKMWSDGSGSWLDGGVWIDESGGVGSGEGWEMIDVVWRRGKVVKLEDGDVWVGGGVAGGVSDEEFVRSVVFGLIDGVKFGDERVGGFGGVSLSGLRLEVVDDDWIEKMFVSERMGVVVDRVGKLLRLLRVVDGSDVVGVDVGWKSLKLDVVSGFVCDFVSGEEFEIEVKRESESWSDEFFGLRVFGVLSERVMKLREYGWDTVGGVDCVEVQDES